MAIRVTDILKQILIDQSRRTISGQEAVRKLLEETRRQVQQELAAMPQANNSYSAWNLQQTLAAINDHLATFGVQANKELGIALTEAWTAGSEMLGQMVVASGNSTFGISSHLLGQFDPWLQNMKDYTWGKVEGVRLDAAAKIRGELSLGILGQKTPFEVAQAVTGNLPQRPEDQPRYHNSEKTIFKSIDERAQIITQTEMGRAFSMAHQASLISAEETLPELQKMWLHAGHPKRARIYHLALHGSIKPVAENWLVGSIAMMYPRDPKAPASEVIRCGCMHTGYMKEWGTEQQIKDAWKEAQDAANKPKGDYDPRGYKPKEKDHGQGK